MTPHTSRFTRMNQTDPFNVKCGDLTPDFVLLLRQQFLCSVDGNLKIAAPIKPDWIIWALCVIKVFVESQTSSRLKSRPKLTFGIAL